MFRSIRRRDIWSEQNVCTVWINQSKCVYTVHISTRDFVSAQCKCTEFVDPGTMGICPEKNPFDHVSLSDEETRDVKKKLDDIDNKFDDARAAKLKCSQ